MIEEAQMLEDEIMVYKKQMIDDEMDQNTRERKQTYRKTKLRTAKGLS